MWRLLNLCAIFTSALGDSQWITYDELQDQLPAILSPILTTQVATRGECLMICDMKGSQCDSVAYSQTYQLCKLFSHPNLKKPLPKLAFDGKLHHQMFFKAAFCPPGWLMDKWTKMCYLGVTTTTYQRPDALQVCDEKFQSTMVTFQSSQQRSNLYKDKYPNILKWWTGYSMFDNKLWQRPVEEIPGFIKRRADCPGMDVLPPPNYVITASAEECAKMCAGSLKDKCVAFLYVATSGECYPKSYSCDSPSGAPPNNERWTYERIPARRPPSVIKSVDCPGNNLKSFIANSYNHCLQSCRQTPSCISSTFDSASKNCDLKYKNCFTPYAAASTVTFSILEDVDDDPCPYALRSHDICLLRVPTTKTFTSAVSYCRNLGGVLLRPIEKEKSSLIWAMTTTIWSDCVFTDYVDDGHEGIWMSSTDSESFNAAAYYRWPWRLGHPNMGTAGNCSCVPYGKLSSAEPPVLLNIACATNHLVVCETPISQSWPMNCRFTPQGSEYKGTLSKTASGANCKNWGSTAYSGDWRNFPDLYTSHSYCRNPDPTVIGNNVWCYRSSDNVPEACNVPMCPESDWAASQVFNDYTMAYGALTYSSNYSENYDWTTESISALANPLCSLPFEKWCPYYFRGSCYMIYHLLRVHSEAATICANNGWHLVTLTSPEEHFFIKTKIMAIARFRTQGSGYHIGLQGNYAIGYSWDNGEPFSYAIWAGGEPGGGSQRCIAMGHSSTDGNWYDDTCSVKNYFICELDLLN